MISLTWFYDGSTIASFDNIDFIDSQDSAKK